MDVEPGLREHVLFVHAHPDDETISTGGTIAVLVAAGAAVTVLTCTRGERGEVIPPELKKLEGNETALARHREGELAAAMTILGVTDHRFLGDTNARLAGEQPRRYLDSGMQWGPDGAEALADADPMSLCAAEFWEVAADIDAVIADIRPTVVVSYDRIGGYGHPDHITAAAAARNAAMVMKLPYFSIVPFARQRPGDLVVDGSAFIDKKVSALAAHRTQLTVDGDTIIHSGGQREPILATESFRMGPADGETELTWEGLRNFSKALASLIGVALGVGVGLVASVNHQLVIPVLGERIWGGVILALAIAAALLVGIRLISGNRIVAGCTAIGMLTVIGVFSIQGPGGSVLIPANPAGWLWAYGPLIIAAVVLAWPRPGTFRRATMGKAGN